MVILQVPLVCEGNMTTVNGTIVYYDKNNNEYLNIFENANNKLEIGNVVQDMYMANGKIYPITQNGDRDEWCWTLCGV